MTVRLSGMTWDHPRGHGALAAASADYRRHHDVDVGWERRSLTDFGDVPVETYARSFDLLIVDHPHIAAAVGAGALRPLDAAEHADDLDRLARHSVGASHASYASAGRQWALAVDAAAQVAVHRPDLLAAPPRSWPEVLELARAGRVLWPAKPVDAYSSLCSVAVALGTPPFAEPGAFLAPDAFRSALGVLHRLAGLVPERCLAMSPIDVAEELAAEQDRFAYAPLLFGYTNYGRAGFRPRRLRYVDAPTGPADPGSPLRPGAMPPPGSMLGGAGIAVSAFTAHPAEATDFAFWVAGEQAQRGSYFAGGGQPGHAAAWEDARLDEQAGGFFSGTRRTLEAAWVRPHDPRYPEFQNAVGSLITDTLAGRLDDAALIRRIDDAAARLGRPADQDHGDHDHEGRTPSC